MNTKKTLAAWLCLIVSLLLFIGGFIVPPMGVIDGSVLKAGGILMGFAALFQAPYLIESLSKLHRAKFTKGDMSIELEQHKEEEDETGTEENL